MGHDSVGWCTNLNVDLSTSMPPSSSPVSSNMGDSGGCSLADCCQRSSVSSPNWGMIGCCCASLYEDCLTRWCEGCGGWACERLLLVLLATCDVICVRSVASAGEAAVALATQLLKYTASASCCCCCCWSAFALTQFWSITCRIPTPFGACTVRPGTLPA